MPDPTRAIRAAERAASAADAVSDASKVQRVEPSPGLLPEDFAAGVRVGDAPETSALSPEDFAGGKLVEPVDPTAGKTQVADGDMFIDDETGEVFKQDQGQLKKLEKSEDGFHLKSQENLNQNTGKKPIPVDQVKARTKEKTVSKDEKEFLNIDGFIAERKAAGAKTVTKEEIDAHIKSRLDQVHTMEFGKTSLSDEASEALEGEARGLEEYYDSLRQELIDLEMEYASFGRVNVSNVRREANTSARRRILDEMNALERRKTEIQEELRGPRAHAEGTNVLGGENYRELVTVVDDIEPYKADDGWHMGTGTGGKAVSWSRIEDMYTEDGGKTFHATEFQSQRHQDGNELGYTSRDPVDNPLTEFGDSLASTYRSTLDDIESAFLAEHKKVDGMQGLTQKEANELRHAINLELDNMLEEVGFPSEEFVVNYSPMTGDKAFSVGKKRDSEGWSTTIAEGDTIADAISAAQAELKAEGRRVPDAPFKKSWYMVEHKRNLMRAIEEGYDSYSWTVSKDVPSRSPRSERFLEDLYDKKSVRGMEKFLKNEMGIDAKVERVRVSSKAAERAMAIEDDLDYVMRSWRLNDRQMNAVREGLGRGYDGDLIVRERLEIDDDSLVGFIDSIGEGMAIIEDAKKSSPQGWRIKITPEMKEKFKGGTALGVGALLFDAPEEESDGAP